MPYRIEVSVFGSYFQATQRVDIHAKYKIKKLQLETVSIFHSNSSFFHTFHFHTKNCKLLSWDNRDNVTLKLRNQNNIKSIQQILTREDIFYFQCPPSISQFVIVEELVLFGEKLFWHLHVWSFNIDKYLKKFSFHISIDTSLDAASKRVNKNK